MKHNLAHMFVPAFAIVTFIVAFAPSSVAMAQEKSLIPEHYILGRMRILYATEGLSAVSPGDVDENGVPDQVENVAKQLWAAHRLFCESLQFPDPFKSERYKDLTCIQVSIRHPTEIGGINGVAFENAQRARLLPGGKREDRALVMAISSQLDPIKNGTPAHEMFHLIQYCATYLQERMVSGRSGSLVSTCTRQRRSWRAQVPTKRPLAADSQHLELLAKMKYDAEFVL